VIDIKRLFPVFSIFEKKLAEITDNIIQVKEKATFASTLRNNIMAYDIQCKLPTRSLGKAPTVFEVTQDGRKLGELCIRKGTVEWVKKHKAIENRYSFTWDEFSKCVTKNNNENKQ